MKIAPMIGEPPMPGEMIAHGMTFTLLIAPFMMMKISILLRDAALAVEDAQPEKIAQPLMMTAPMTMEVLPTIPNMKNLTGALAKMITPPQMLMEMIAHGMITIQLVVIIIMMMISLPQ
jgi:hypothetical protein